MSFPQHFVKILMLKYFEVKENNCLCKLYKLFII